MMPSRARTAHFTRVRRRAECEDLPLRERGFSERRRDTLDLATYAENAREPTDRDATALAQTLGSSDPLRAVGGVVARGRARRLVGGLELVVVLVVLVGIDDIDGHAALGTGTYDRA